MDLGTSVLAGAGISALAGLTGSAMGASAASNLNSNTRKFMHREAIAADARQLANAKDLFYTQQYMGPQYSVKGLKAAGLNPVLATGSMSGGSMPSFSAHMPSGNPSPADMSEYYTKGADSIASAVGMILQGKSMAADIALKSANAQAVKDRTDIMASMAEVNKILAASKASTEAELPAKVQAEVKKLEGDALLNQARKDAVDSQIAVNSAQVRDLESRISLRDRQENSDYIGLPFGIGRVHFNNDKVVNALADNLVPAFLRPASNADAVKAKEAALKEWQAKWPKSPNNSNRRRLGRMGQSPWGTAPVPRKHKRTNLGPAQW